MKRIKITGYVDIDDDFVQPDGTLTDDGVEEVESTEVGELDDLHVVVIE